MEKVKLYRYFGRNGFLTSPILLDGIPRVDLLEITPKDGYVLINGTRKEIHQVIIFADEIDQWHEVKATDIKE